jgi:hypothetical protein
MSSISLESAIRTCKVDTAWANRVQSDRFLNPENMICPTWTGLDFTGRTVCNHSFMHEKAGCNSADDRVEIENQLRPDYISYLNLDAKGIDGDIYKESLQHTGQYGTDFQRHLVGKCPNTSYGLYQKGLNSGMSATGAPENFYM